MSDISFTNIINNFHVKLPCLLVVDQSLSGYPSLDEEFDVSMPTYGWSLVQSYLFLFTWPKWSWYSSKISFVIRVQILSVLLRHTYRTELYRKFCYVPDNTAKGDSKTNTFPVLPTCKGTCFQLKLFWTHYYCKCL